MAWATNYRFPDGDLSTQLRARGIDPKSIRTVVMTHLHFDHTSGIAEFPNATFVIAKNEWEAATTVKRPIEHGYRRAHFDYLFDYRMLDFNSALVDSYASFGRTFDLFGDGSIRLAFTPGHTLGHMSVIARLASRDFVIAGDAVYTAAQLRGANEPAAARGHAPVEALAARAAALRRALPGRGRRHPATTPRPSAPSTSTTSSGSAGR